VDIFEGLEVDPKIKESISSYVKKRLAPQPVKIRSDFEVTCFTYEGIDAIKQALTDGEGKGKTKRNLLRDLSLISLSSSRYHGHSHQDKAVGSSAVRDDQYDSRQGCGHRDHEPSHRSYRGHHP
jgi:translation initiation factor 2 alpha subunit (eIF-2alpha)